MNVPDHIIGFFAESIEKTISTADSLFNKDV